jgi:hypothetical protein
MFGNVSVSTSGRDDDYDGKHSDNDYDYHHHRFRRRGLRLLDGNDANDGLTPLTPIRFLDGALYIAKISNSSHIFVSGDYTLTTNAVSANSGWMIKTATNILISAAGIPILQPERRIGIQRQFGLQACGDADELQRRRVHEFCLTGAYAASTAGGEAYVVNSRNMGLYITASNNHCGLAAGYT